MVGTLPARLTMIWNGRLINTSSATAATFEYGVTAAMAAVLATIKTKAATSKRLVGPSFGMKGPITQP